MSHYARQNEKLKVVETQKALNIYQEIISVSVLSVSGKDDDDDEATEAQCKKYVDRACSGGNPIKKGKRLSGATLGTFLSLRK